MLMYANAGPAEPSRAGVEAPSSTFLLLLGAEGGLQLCLLLFTHPPSCSGALEALLLSLAGAAVSTPPLLLAAPPSGW